MEKEKTFTYGEVLDILQGIIDEEQEKCDRFYEENPKAGVRRQINCSLVRGAIMLAMYAFDERKEI